jgi:hypothetical protein
MTTTCQVETKTRLTSRCNRLKHRRKCADEYIRGWTASFGGRNGGGAEWDRGEGTLAMGRETVVR